MRSNSGRSLRNPVQHVARKGCLGNWPSNDSSQISQFSKIRSYCPSIEEAEKMTGREDWMTQAVFINRATSQNIKSSSSIELFPPFVRFLRETPRPRDGICCNTLSDTLPCTKRVITCR